MNENQMSELIFEMRAIKIHLKRIADALQKPKTAGEMAIEMKELPIDKWL